MKAHNNTLDLYLCLSYLSPKYYCVLSIFFVFFLLIKCTTITYEGTRITPMKRENSFHGVRVCSFISDGGTHIITVHSFPLLTLTDNFFLINLTFGELSSSFLCYSSAHQMSVNHQRNYC